MSGKVIVSTRCTFYGTSTHKQTSNAHHTNLHDCYYLFNVQDHQYNTSFIAHSVLNRFEKSKVDASTSLLPITIHILESQIITHYLQSAAKNLSVTNNLAGAVSYEGKILKLPSRFTLRKIQHLFLQDWQSYLVKHIQCYWCSKQ